VKTPQRLHALVQGGEQGVPREERSLQDQESCRAPTKKQSCKGWTMKEVSCSKEDVERGETPEAA